MRALNGIGLIIVAFLAIGFVLWLGNRTVTSFTRPTPVSSSTLPEKPPKIIDTGKQIVIFQNPIINEPGLSVEEVMNKADELKGQAVEVKGQIGSRDGDWGFWLNETNGERDSVFILTHPSLATDNITPIGLLDKKYVRVRGVLKDVTWTQQSTLSDANSPDQPVFSTPQRLSIVVTEIIPIDIQD